MSIVGYTAFLFWIWLKLHQEVQKTQEKYGQWPLTCSTFSKNIWRYFWIFKSSIPNQIKLDTLWRKRRVYNSQTCTGVLRIPLNHCHWIRWSMLHIPRWKTILFKWRLQIKILHQQRTISDIELWNHGRW